jgi:hypothetical protein
VSLDSQLHRNLIEAIAGSLAESRPRPVDLPQFSAAVLGKQYVDLYRRLLSAGPGIMRASHSHHSLSACGEQSWRAGGEELDAI